VADALLREKPDAAFDQGAFLDRCMRLGKQYLLQHRIQSAESVSKVLFETALKLARNRGLLDAGAADLAERRKAFADEIRDAIRRVDAIELLAQSRVAGLIP
jgi:glycerol-3-phosphate O-acyltransferase